MELGIVGLGRMGANMARRLMRDGHRIVAFDVNPDAVSALAGEGAEGASSLEDLASKLSAPRAVWVMVPAGEITEKTVEDVAAVLEPGDAIIDGGNSYYRDDIRRAEKLREQGIDYVDCGTSGGVFGLERGYCLMIGGPDGGGAAARPDLRLARARRGVGGAHAGPQRRSLAGGERLPALRPQRRRALREDGPQRDRVRDHGRLRRGPQHPQERQRRQGRSARPTPRRRRWSSPSTTSTTSTCPRSPRSGGAAA